MRHDDYTTSDSQSGANGGAHRGDVRNDDDARVERLREEVRRYEQDLRELADA